VQFSELQKPRDLDLDRVIRHTIAHQSATYIYIANFIEIGKNFVDGWTYRRRDVRTYLLVDNFRPPLILLGRLGGVHLKITHVLQWIF